MNTNTKLTVAQMTARYNVAAAELDLPMVKKLKPTKDFETVQARYDAMASLLVERTGLAIGQLIVRNRAKAIKKASEKPKAAEKKIRERGMLVNPMETRVVANEIINPNTKKPLTAPNAGKIVAPAPVTKKPAASATGIRTTRPGTSIYFLLECVLIGGTVEQIHAMLLERGVSWTENAIRAALSWDIPKKGYEVEKFPGDNGIRYKISNANGVV